MKKDEYIETLNINGRLVNIGEDDNGQCYFMEFIEDNEVKTVGLGTYNENYKEEAKGYFNDPPTPEEFEKEMKEICENSTEDSLIDIEENHKLADEYMCQVLCRYGYGAGVHAFRKMEKWYS